MRLLFITAITNIKCKVKSECKIILGILEKCETYWFEISININEFYYKYIAYLFK